MKKRIIWVGISCLMVAALVLSSCQPAVVEEEKETETVTGEVTETVAPVVEEEEEEEAVVEDTGPEMVLDSHCLLYTSPSPRDRQKSRMPSSA